MINVDQKIANLVAVLDGVWVPGKGFPEKVPRKGSRKGMPGLDM